MHSFLCALDYRCDVTTWFKFLLPWLRYSDGLSLGTVSQINLPAQNCCFITGVWSQQHEWNWDNCFTFLHSSIPLPLFILVGLASFNTMSKSTWEQSGLFQLTSSSSSMRTSKGSSRGRDDGWMLLTRLSFLCLSYLPFLFKVGTRYPPTHSWLNPY